MSDEELTAESIVERILFGKGGSKSDYAEDINDLVSIKCKKKDEEIEELKKVAYRVLPADCLEPEWTDVKFCSLRQGEGNKCQHCSVNP